MESYTLAYGVYAVFVCFFIIPSNVCVIMNGYQIELNFTEDTTPFTFFVGHLITFMKLKRYNAIVNIFFKTVIVLKKIVSFVKCSYHQLVEGLLFRATVFGMHYLQKRLLSVAEECHRMLQLHRLLRYLFITIFYSYFTQ